MRLLALLTVRPGKVELVLIDRAFPEEVLKILIVLEIKQLVLNQPVE